MKKFAHSQATNNDFRQPPTFSKPYSLSRQGCDFLGAKIISASIGERAERFIFGKQNGFVMVKISELKPGDIVMVMEEGAEREGVVTEVQRDQNLVCIDNGIQDFWYGPADILSIPLDEEQLLKLGFQRQDTDDGIKYLKGPFRILLREEGNFANLEMWYREDRRHFNTPLTVHELQNRYLDMTKVPLERVQA